MDFSCIFSWLSEVRTYMRYTPTSSSSILAAGNASHLGWAATCLNKLRWGYDPRPWISNLFKVWKRCTSLLGSLCPQLRRNKRRPYHMYTLHFCFTYTRVCALCDIAYGMYMGIYICIYIYMYVCTLTWHYESHRMTCPLEIISAPTLFAERDVAIPQAIHAEPQTPVWLHL